MDRIRTFLGATEGLKDHYRNWVDHQPFGAPQDVADRYRLYKYNQNRSKKPVMTFNEWREADRRAELAKEEAKKNPQYGPAYVKKTYGLDINPLGENAFNTPEQLIAAMRTDAAKWLQTIKSSQKFREFCGEVINAWKDGDPDDGPYWGMWDNPKTKVTQALIARDLKIEEGVNGWEESMQVCRMGSANQQYCVACGWITADIADMLSIKYGAYLKGVDTGDGDEGHVYYEINL